MQNLLPQPLGTMNQLQRVVDRESLGGYLSSVLFETIPSLQFCHREIWLIRSRHPLSDQHVAAASEPS